MLRGIDRFFDLGELRTYLAPFYSHTGRPSTDPELVMRMLIVGYCFDIRSERRLCEEIHLNLAYRWFCRLDLEDAVPDHSTFSKNRHGRFRESDAFRHVFERRLRRPDTAIHRMEPTDSRRAGSLEHGLRGEVALWVLHTSRRLPAPKVRAFVAFMCEQYPQGLSY